MKKRYLFPKRLCAAMLAGTVLVAAAGISLQAEESVTEAVVQDAEAAPETETEVPATEAVTEAAETEASAAEAAETETPAAEAVTEAAETEAPATEAAETEAPATETVTEAAETEAPATEAVTEAPVTEAVTEAAETEAPATGAEAPATESETQQENVTEEVCSLQVVSNIPEDVQLGDTIVLTCIVEGYEEGTYTLQWQYRETDWYGEFIGEWTDEPEATEEELSVILTEESALRAWRVVLVEQ